MAKKVLAARIPHPRFASSIFWKQTVFQLKLLPQTSGAPRPPPRQIRFPAVSLDIQDHHTLSPTGRRIFPTKAWVPGTPLLRGENPAPRRRYSAGASQNPAPLRRGAATPRKKRGRHGLTDNAGSTTASLSRHDGQEGRGRAGRRSGFPDLRARRRVGLFLQKTAFFCTQSHTTLL